MLSLENQVREALQQSRQSWEESHGAKLLAVERLRLVKEEYEAAVTTEKAAYANLKAIQEKSGGEETSKALEGLKMEVNQLEKDVAFQHNGLVQTQAKLESETKSLEQAKTNHSSRIAELEAFLHQSRRAKNNDHAAATTTTKSSSMQMLQVHMDHLNHHSAADDDTASSRWPTIFRKKSQSLRHAMAEEKATISSLERIISGYEKHFPADNEPSS